MAVGLALPTSSFSSLRPTNLVHLHALPLAAILDHHLRRDPSQDRVFGTLLGTRSDNEVEIKGAFGIPYEVEGEGQVRVDMDHHKALLDLHLRTNPREGVVGWYATHAQLNSFSALIHSFYLSETPSPAVHLTLDPATLAFSAYTSSPLGLSQRADQLAFNPVPSVLKIEANERPAIDLLALKSSPSPSSGEGQPAMGSQASLESPLQVLNGLLSNVEDMLGPVLEYVKSVNKGEKEGDEQLGRRLYETLAIAPSKEQPEADAAGASTTAESGSSSNASSSKKPRSVEEEFNDHLADVLMVSYLSNLIKTQAEISGRLGLVV